MTTQSDWLDALKEYAELREEIGRLEETGECSCDERNFHRCDLCEETTDKSWQANRLMNLWGDTWAMRLFEVKAEAGK